MHSLFLCSNEETVPSEGNELARMQSMIAERIFMPRLSDYEKLILRLQSEEFEAAVNYKEACQAASKPSPTRYQDRPDTDDLGKDVST